MVRGQAMTPSRDTPITLTADDRGVWRHLPGGAVDGIEWSEILGVVVFRQAGYPGLRVGFAFDVPMVFAISDNEEGFDQVMAAVERRLPGVDPSWRIHGQQLAP